MRLHDQAPDRVLRAMRGSSAGRARTYLTSTDTTQMTVCDRRPEHDMGISMKRMSLPIFALAAALTLVGCVETEGKDTTETAKVGSNASTEAPSDASEDGAAEETVDSEAELEDDGIATFGETYEWEDGLSISVSAPKPFKPTDSASGGEDAAAHLRFTVVVVNGTGAKFDASGFSSTLQSNDQEADEVFDAAGGLDGSPSTTLLPGRQAKWEIGYGVANPDDLVLEIEDWEHSSVIFTNAM